MSRPDLVCWKCGAALDEVPLPLSRTAVCPGCDADLHVCRMCEFYDPAAARSCREPVADEVRNKEKANFCGYLKPRPGAFSPPDSAEAMRAKSELDALFGLGSPPEQTEGDEAAGESAQTDDEAQEAKRKLEELFGLDGGAGKKQKG